MYKRSSSRNQRSRGIKVKYVLQICLLVALCCWLIYQVKHSHDKKREFDDSAKVSLSAEQKDGVVKLGRRYLDPQMKDKAIKTGKRDEEEEETSVEEEDSKHEEIDEQDDNKNDEKEEDIDEGTDGGEELDEQEKSDTGNDQEVDFEDDEKERENVDEQELGDKDAEDSERHTDNDSASREYLKKGEGITNTREAREENYKADDASSSVTHDTQIVTTGNQTRIMRESNQLDEVSEFDPQTQSINSVKIGAGNNLSVKAEDGETANNGSHLADIATSNVTKKSKNHKESNNLNAVRFEPQDENVVEGHKNTTFQSTDNKLEGNSTLPGSNDRHNVSSTINVETKDIDPSLKESKKSDDTESSISKMWTNVSGKSEEASDETKDNRADGINEKFDESKSDTSDELEVDLIDSSDTTNTLEENYI